MTREEKALLDMIAYTEGTLGVSNNGYDVVYGTPYKIIAGWTPDTKIVHGCWGTDSTAAGRYQFLCKTWKGGTAEKPGPNLPMTKENQDKRGLELINRRLGSIDKTSLVSDKNVFLKALNLLSPEWESIPIGTNDFLNNKKENNVAGYSYYKSNNKTYKPSRNSVDKCYEVYKTALKKY